MPLQTGALPWRIADCGQPQLLLVTGRRSGRWIIPKGWPMIGKSLARAAACEAFEEAGVTGTVDPKPIGSFRHVKRGIFGSRTVKIVVHLLAVTEELADWPERGQRSRRWFTIEEAAQAVESEDLRALITSAGARLKRARVT